jgi:glycosyltransferase involved in cell wall biosynthesis
MHNADRSILFLTLRADFGGGPEHLWQLLRHLPGGTRACVACPQDYPYYERYRDCVGAENIVILPHRRFRLSALWRLRAFCRERGVTILHSHGKGAGLYARLLALLTGLPCAHTFHGVHMREYGSKQSLYRLLERCLSLFTRAAIAVSEGERAQILAAGLMPAAKIHLIPNGVEIPETTTGQAAGPPFRVISMSRFDYQKNSGLLINIAQTLRQRGRLEDFRFVVVGDGPDRAGVMATAHTNGLADYLECPGARPDPHACFADALCYLSTSRWEGLPLAVLEAMAHGLPAVATDVMGNREAVINGETGFLYPEGAADAAASALCLLADEPERRQALGERAREYVRQRHDARKMAADTLALLHGIARNAS